ncbi:MAG: transcriptional regulator, LacI family [Chloroflexi bacterium]|nr:transcriptional regulator, LacI family [Chloroflexota bacterium]
MVDSMKKQADRGGSPIVERRARLEDVARLAGVSPTTVSRALRNDARISENTRVSVQHAANRLGYIPDARASSLRGRATSTIGLLLPDVADPMHGQFAMAVEQAASAQGYTVLLANGISDPVQERQALQVFTAQRADGIVLVGSMLSPQEAKSLVGPCPVVLVGGENVSLAGYKNELPTGSIRVDDISGMVAVVEHLRECGYTRVAYVNGPDLASNFTRRDAALSALANAGITSALYPYPGGVESLGALNATVSTLVADRPQALICYDDVEALGIMDALRSRGVRVPDDIAIVGFDDIPFAGIANPRLTTVAQPSEEVGRSAFAMLLAGLKTGELPPSISLPVRLMVRESTKNVADSTGS